MRDFAISAHAGVAAQLARIGALSVPTGRLGLETITALLERLGNPQHRLPPVFHVAGTNGKGSTCTFLRAMLEAQGLVVHSATKPHLVRYNERIRLAGQLIEDDALAALLARVLDASEQSDNLHPSFFEVTTAAIFLAFADVPADACVIEVGLGGRLDATNVLVAPAACGVAALGIDHESFLLRPEAGAPTQPLARIAWEKALIARANRPLVTQSYPPEASAQVKAVAAQAGAVLAMRGVHWWAQANTALHYRDAMGELTLPLPSLAGAHQADNAALAVAMLRHQGIVPVSPMAMAQGIKAARWPARLQKLGAGPLVDAQPHLAEIWLDGGHNPDAAQAIARHFASGAKLHLVLGMLANKDAERFISTLAPVAQSLTVVPVPGHDHHDAPALAAMANRAGIATVQAAPDVATALALLTGVGLDGATPRALVCGSLYLAGDVLARNAELPD
jgi:dihydrofolate synthase/folylpolyglutamate synthase